VGGRKEIPLKIVGREKERKEGEGSQPHGEKLDRIRKEKGNDFEWEDCQSGGLVCLFQLRKKQKRER